MKDRCTAPRHVQNGRGECCLLSSLTTALKTNMEFVRSQLHIRRIGHRLKATERQGNPGHARKFVDKFGVRAKL